MVSAGFLMVTKGQVGCFKQTLIFAVGKANTRDGGVAQRVEGEEWRSWMRERNVV